jgi:prepilin-type N-terminal cleavage/methylation domain-containing protein
MPTLTFRTGPAKNSAAETALRACPTFWAADTSFRAADRVRQAARQGSRARSAFTLIELLAVLLIMGLAMALVLPNLGSRQTSELRDQAVLVAAQLELARQLAVVTGYPHRMLIDVESGAFRLEWFGGRPEDQLGDEEEAPPADPYGANQGYDFAPPTDDHLSYRPVDGRFGNDSFLDSDFFFDGLDTGEGWFDSGEIQLVFDRDGTTDAAELVIADDNGNSLILQVRPLLDSVRILDAES